MKRQELRNRGVADVDLEMATTQALGNALAARERAHDVWVWREHVGALDSALTDIT
jgi:predicted transglutaminase-like cysteine proteinase